MIEFNVRAYKDFKTIKSTTIHHEGKLTDVMRYIRKFLSFIRKDLRECDSNDVALFVAHVNKKYSTRYVNDMKSYLKEFIKETFPDDYITRFKRVDKILKREKAPEVYTPSELLSREDVERLVQGEPSPTWKAYFLVQYYGGLRPCEATSLKHDQIEYSNEGAFISIYSKKNKRNFIKFVPENVAFYLKQLKTNGSIYCFPSPQEQTEGKKRGVVPISSRAVFQRLKRLSLKVLGRRVNPYNLRHSLASELYNREGLKGSIVAEQMGHSEEMRTTYSHPSQAKLKELVKSVYIKAQLTPEKKIELEEQIADLKKRYDEEKHLNELRMNDLLKEVKSMQTALAEKLSLQK